ncbi:hypothetical protein [Flavivirga jejuensis]|uniref:Uncharacterized protein n=1 Tax=Flavivirga jejuensis TaxID=870487 RepID=A0ABT8WJH1_9FLAO|nr:hypothetical protein [Flavivirga jejuensis]MDO5973280.1 hypothetical protein [Flavivirga jejuensis]
MKWFKPLQFINSGLMYPEIINIQNFIATKGVTTCLGKVPLIDQNLIPVILKIGNDTYVVHVLDEYDDLNYYNPILNFIIVFRAITIIDDSQDFLTWCKQQGLNPNNHKLLSYYKDICAAIYSINNYFHDNKINYFILDLDFQLNTGVIGFLRS